nr:hypothetical protein [uncultured Ottowia sp.]
MKVLPQAFMQWVFPGAGIINGHTRFSCGRRARALPDFSRCGACCNSAGKHDVSGRRVHANRLFGMGFILPREIILNTLSKMNEN